MLIDLNEETFDGEELDVVPHTAPPEYDRSQTGPDDEQDDEADDTPVGLTFFSKVVGATRSWSEALNWYRNHRTANAIGFDPDGMCLKICRTARNIPAKYLTAREAMLATPEEFRVYKVRDLRRGMVAFYADPNDSNPADHIVTVAGRVKGFDPDDLDDVLFETNSVVPDGLVIVRGTYFEEHWGDPFKFGATWLNGVELDTPHHLSKVERFNNGGPVYDLNLLEKAGKNRPKPAAILARIETQIKRLPENPKLVRVRGFKDEWRADRKIDLSLLDAAVREGRVGVVKQVRDEIRRLIETLPDE